MMSVLTPSEFFRLLDDYTLRFLGSHPEMYELKEQIKTSYRNLYEQIPHVESTARPHAHLIKAWADGATIECWYPTEQIWVEREIPNWLPEFEYRIKGDDHGS